MHPHLRNHSADFTALADATIIFSSLNGQLLTIPVHSQILAFHCDVICGMLAAVDTKPSTSNPLDITPLFEGHHLTSLLLALEIIYVDSPQKSFDKYYSLSMPLNPPPVSEQSVIIDDTFKILDKLSYRRLPLYSTQRPVCTKGFTDTVEEDNLEQAAINYEKEWDDAVLSGYQA